MLPFVTSPLSTSAIVPNVTNTSSFCDSLRSSQGLLRGPAEPAGANEETTAWTLISGRETPIRLPTSNHEVPPVPGSGGGRDGPGGPALKVDPAAAGVQTDFTAQSLPRSDLSAFIESKVRDVVRSKCSDDGTAETVTVREVSCIVQATTPNETIRDNFADVPPKVEYLSRR